MAACLVTVSGTSGSVLIEYIDAGSVKHSIISDITTSLYIETGGSAYTYTTLSGDAIASSGCITITALPAKCYIFDWEWSREPMFPYDLGLLFTELIVGSTTYTLLECAYPNSGEYSVLNAVNALDVPEVKGVAYKTVYPSDLTLPVEYFAIIKVKGNEIPYLKIRNQADTHSIFLKGTYTADCLPAGYTEVDTCAIGTSLP